MILNTPVRASSSIPIYKTASETCLKIDDCVQQRKAVREGKIEMRAVSHGHYPGKRMKSNSLPGLSNVGFWNSRRCQDWGVDHHRNEGVEIVYLETGNTGFEVDGRHHSLRAGDLTITRPWQLHRLGDPHVGRGKLYWLILDVGVRRPHQEWKWPAWVVLAPRDLADLTVKLRHGDTAVWQAGPRVREVFREIGECVVGWAAPRSASRLAVAVNRLLVELLDLPAGHKCGEQPDLAGRRRTVELFLRDLAENPASAAEPWSLDAMAGQCGMGITTMTKYCRELVNNGPMAYLNFCRLDHAARMLESRPAPSVTHVAQTCGFNTSQYFATAFRKRYRTTPLAYRCASG
jgi:AraC-like DNA-binding protein